MATQKAQDIIDLLKAKHSEDVFIPECKNGPTWTSGSMLRMDAWVMKRSWSKPLITAYEVKVSRGDFINDDKWPGYLDYCNQFYFVCPTGLISPDELSQDVGLMYVASTGSRLITKKKAPYRNVNIPESIYRYIIMSRARITNGTYGNTEETDEEFWRRWMKEKEDNLNFGHKVSKRIWRIIEKKILDVESDNRTLNAENVKLLGVKKFCEAHDIDVNRHFSPVNTLRDRLGVPRDIVHAIDRGISALELIRGKLEN